jgi:molybdate/tungstate transport system substrate-binding protein
VLTEPGIKIGRTDPKLDPKGSLTLTLMKQAESFYKSPGLAQAVLGAAQVQPEETLIGRLQSGQIDVGFFYSTETAGAKIPALSLPPAIAPRAIYTVTVLHNASNPVGANQFVAYLLGRDGQNLLKEHGLTLPGMHISGDASAVPQNIKAIIDKAT